MTLEIEPGRLDFGKRDKALDKEIILYIETLALDVGSFSFQSEIIFCTIIITYLTIKRNIFNVRYL